MKKALLLMLMQLSITLLIAQPSNDFISNAKDLGILPTPGACTAGIQNGVQVTLNNESTLGATASNPYYYMGSCNGINSMAAPALDVWYKFIASGTTMNISITNFPGVNIGIFEGIDSSSLAPRACSVNTGSLTMTQGSIGNTYY